MTTHWYHARRIKDSVVCPNQTTSFRLDRVVCYVDHPDGCYVEVEGCYAPFVIETKYLEFHKIMQEFKG